MKRRVLAVAALAMTVAGCGGGSPESTTKDYLHAFADGNGEEACSHLTGDGKRELLELMVDAGQDGSCSKLDSFVEDILGDEEVKKLKEFIDEGKYSVDTKGSSATVTVKYKGDESNPVELRKVDGEWRIDSGFSG